MKIKSLASRIVSTITIAAAVAITGLTAKADQGVNLTQSQPRNAIKFTPIAMTNTAVFATTNDTHAAQPINDVVPGNTALLISGGAFSTTTNSGNLNLPIYRTLDGVNLETTPFAYVTLPLTANSATNPTYTIVSPGTNVWGKGFAIGGVGNTQAAGTGSVTNLGFAFLPLQ